MRVTHLAAECVPFAKTGGLGDVVGALPKAQAARGHDVDVFLPFHLEAAEWYRRRLTWPEQALPPFAVSILGRPYVVGLLRGTLPGSAVPVHFVAHDPMFHRTRIYAPDASGRDDGLWRFALFVRASIEAMRRMGRRPQILHAHDWHAALAVMLGAWSSWRDRWFDDIASVLTIHNVWYQGVYGPEEFPALGLPPEAWSGGGIRFAGAVNLLKGAIVAADMLTAVSPTYAREITTREGGMGLDGVLRSRRDRLVGILNGIDTAIWNPAVDEFVAARYSASDLSGKSACRRDLCRVAGLDPGVAGMVLGSVGRLTDQKGFDLIMGAAPELIRRGLRFVLLGSGEPQLEHALRRLALQYPGRIAAFVGFSEELAHKIEAGADAFLMPSRFEPCGLNQMYSLAYGTPPVVRRVGGLADSVEPFDGYNLDRGTGFVFQSPSAHELAAEVLRAHGLFQHPEAWRQLMERGMSRDFSWERSAASYDAVYRRAREIRGLPW
ncbi:MAG: glycogen synthase GlgA [Acidithiobacillales bacterium]